MALLRTYSSPHAASMIRGRRHSASETMGSVASLTFDEFVNLVPALKPPPTVLAKLQQHRALIESQLPMFTEIVQQRAEILAGRGLNIPARFLPQRPQTSAASQEELLTVVADLYRKNLNERYAS